MLSEKQVAQFLLNGRLHCENTFWLVLVCLIVAGVVVGQDQANHDYAGLELDAAGQTEFVSDLRIDAPSLLSDEELGRAADQAAVSMLKDLSGKADSVEGKEIRYSVVDTHNVPPHILRVVEETKTHPTTMVFEGDSGTQYVHRIGRANDRRLPDKRRKRRTSG